MGVTSGGKPTFALSSAKKPASLGSKPTFAVKKKPAQPIADDFAEGDKALAEPLEESYKSPERKSNPYAPSMAQSASRPEPEDALEHVEETEPSTTPNLPRKDLAPISSLKKPPALFKKPMLPSKKKFQMAAPDAAEQEKFDKLTIKKVKEQEQARHLQTSALKN